MTDEDITIENIFEHTKWLEKDEALRLLTCSALSMASYCETEEKMQSFLNTKLKSHKHGLTEIALSGEGCIQPYALGLKPSTKELYVAFRGTSTIQDVLIDLHAFGIPGELRGRFHDGFYNRASVIPAEPFVSFLEEYDDYTIIFTGHSMGGPVATIKALMLMRDGRIQSQEGKSRVLCVTFGAPWCCDMTAAEDNKIYQANFCHYINQEDIVPRLFSLTEMIRAALFKTKERTHCITAQKLAQEASELFSQVFLGEKEKTWLKMFKPRDPLLKGFCCSLVKYLVYLQPTFVGFGRFLQIRAPALSRTSSDKTLFVKHNYKTTEIDSQVLADAFKRQDFETVLKPESVQDHNMFQGYCHTLRTRICGLWPNIKSIDSVATSIASPSSILGTYFMHSEYTRIQALPSNSDNQEANANCQEAKAIEMWWAVVHTVLDESEELNLTLSGPKAFLTTGVKITGTKYAEQPQSPSGPVSGHCLTFQLDLPKGELKRQDYKVGLVGHFGYATVILDPKKFTEAEELKGRLRQVAELDIRQLYTLAFTYSLFTDARDVAPTAERGMAVPFVNKRVQCLEILLECFDRFAAEAVKFAKTDEFCEEATAEIQQIALDLENDEKITGKPSSASVKDLLEHPGEESPESPKTLMSFREIQKQCKTLTSLREIQKQWQAVKIEHSTDAIKLAQPVILATFGSMFEGLKVASNIEKTQYIWLGITVIAGCCVGFLSGAFLIMTAPWLGGAMLGLCAVVGGVSLHGVLGLLETLNAQYLHILREWVRSLGLDLARIRNDAYSLEKAISGIYKQKFEGKVDYTIEKNWNSYFPCGSLNIVAKCQRRYCIRVLKNIHGHHQLREILSQDVGLGVIGTGKTGKSTFLATMFGCDSNPHADERTKDLCTFRIHERFYAVDFPHMTSAIDQLRLCYRANHSLVHLLVVVLTASQGGDCKTGEQMVVDVAKRFAKAGTRVLYCFNAADRILYSERNRSRFQGGRNQKAVPGSRGRANADEKKASAGEMSKEKLKIRLEANASSYGLDPKDCMLTAFELDDKNMDATAFWTKMEELEKRGIYNTRSIKSTWLCKELAANGLSKDDIDKICLE
eukprot:gb/GEZN01000953.1/.p1 GENE.gb/GEZN01000953.1/~~gb/GEZN01000953.1/.p1  ORF type:complete len:1091 (+),score=89.84 gb/GEZN01000953.1/:144-3416(+)